MKISGGVRLETICVLRASRGRRDKRRGPHPLRAGGRPQPDRPGPPPLERHTDDPDGLPCHRLGLARPRPTRFRPPSRGSPRELLSLSEPLHANSDWAQGGIIYDTNPDPAGLTRDILAAGDNLNNPAAVEQLAREGPGLVREILINDLGVAFDHDNSGHLDFTREGGHAERRIIHTRDFTGHSILKAVADRFDATPRDNPARGLGGHRPADPLAQHDGARRQVRAPDLLRGLRPGHGRTGEVAAVTARKTVLACRGPWEDLPALDEPARQRGRKQCRHGLPGGSAADRPRIRAVSPGRFSQRRTPPTSSSRRPCAAKAGSS